MKVAIIGGGGGASNAANVIRSLDKQAQIDIFTNREDIGNLPCEIPFVIKGAIPSWESSFAFKEKFYKERNIQVHFNTEITEIFPREKRITAEGNNYSYDKAILDLGSIPSIPRIEGLNGRNEYFLTTWTKHGKEFAQIVSKYRSAAVIGTGQIALEVAEILKGKGYEKVYLLGRSERILRAYLDRDMVEIVESAIRDSGIELILSAKMLGVKTNEDKKILSLSDRDIETDFLFLAAGMEPNTGLAKRAGLKLGRTQAIAVNEYLQTSDHDIYAIGDCMENYERITGDKIRYQTATNAARNGRLAGKNLALGNVFPYNGTVMPFVTEAFGYQIGTVGFTEDRARERGIDVVSNLIETSTRRRPFGGKPVRIKLIADRKTKTLVGAQLIGGELVSGKIDKLAVAVACKIPVEQLSLIDTCYSPTLGSSYEALTMALDELQEKFA
ncbi:MAG: FAD-dependent oxidoreductase [Dehalococcoidia bacterium]|nr:FAD-dependent oxidoreductase [Dehalococcoidia bacterium]